MKLMVVLSRIPYPLLKGDILRAYHQIKQLSKNHEVHLFALSDQPVSRDNIKEVASICSSVTIHKLNKVGIWSRLAFNFFSTLPFQVAYFNSRVAKKKLRKVINEIQPDHLYCQLIRTAEFANEAKNVPKTIDLMDAFSEGIRKRIDTVPLVARWLFRVEHGRLKNYEKKVASLFETSTVISEQDRIKLDLPSNANVHVIPNGVDTDYFHPIKVEKKFELIFNGNMSYPPNIESVQFLVKEVLPLLKEKIPEITLLISGTNPVQEVKQLAGKNIHVSGWVDDIRNNYASAKINIAPMIISIGMQNKLLEAMAMGIPCITSVAANNALGATNGKHILTASNAIEFSDCIIRLLNNESMRKEIAENGKKFVEETYTWSHTTSLLESAMQIKSAE